MAIACGVGLCLLGIMSAFVWFRANIPDGYTPGLFRLFGLVSLIASTLLLFHLGHFSPAPLVVSMGALFFAQGSDRLGAIVICGTAVVTYLLGALLIAAEVLPDLGVIPGGDNLAARLFFVWHVPLVHLVCTIQGLSNRVAVEDLETRLTQTSRQLSIEQVRFEELRHQYDAAAKQVGKHQGIRSGSQVGDYFLGALIGRGGAAEIYEAENMQTGESGALKLLHSTLDENETTIRRFHREAALAATVQHPNVVRIKGHGQTPDGLFFLYMERLTGEDLSTRLRNHPRMSKEALERLVTQVAHGLQAVHDAQIVHRDIQPRNLFWAQFSSQGCWKLLDFGIAKQIGTMTLTRDEVMGTPGYMSPEQASNRTIDHRSDLFSLGAVIYRALLGRPPYWGPSPILTVHDIAMGRPLNPRQLDPNISSDLERFLVVALAYEPVDRFQTAGSMQQEFRRALEGKLSPDVREKSQKLLFERGWAEHTGELQTMRFLPDQTPAQTISDLHPAAPTQANKTI